MSLGSCNLSRSSLNHGNYLVRHAIARTQFARFLSIPSAIRDGIRQSKRGKQEWRKQENVEQPWQGANKSRQNENHTRWTGSGGRDEPFKQASTFPRTIDSRSSRFSDTQGSSTSYPGQKDLFRTRRASSEKPPRPFKKPEPIPYTTAASEFLYGTSVVKSALRAQNRKLYNLYIYQGEQRKADNEDVLIRKLSLLRGVKVTEIKTLDRLALMDKMSKGRPHNGYLLEASPLPKYPISSLGSVDQAKGIFHLAGAEQSFEEEEVNGTKESLDFDASGGRNPFIVMLDGILDPGNLGAIVRSASYLGVDAIVLSTHNAPMGAVALKSSAGAMESFPLLTVRSTGDLIQRSQDLGWKFYAAIAPPSTKSSHDGTSRIARSNFKPHLTTSSLGAPLWQHPCVLILGSEGQGIRPDIQRKADFTMSIGGGNSSNSDVDSLNVSVAAGILCDHFLRSPEKGSSSLGSDNVLY